MSGRPKKGLDYAPWSVDMFDGDRKIDALLDKYGWKGFGIYFYLCQKAYQTNGYYLEWGFADCPTTARRLGGGVSATTVEQTVSFCLHVNLFDEKIFESMVRDGVGVLTSRGLQRRYWSVISSTRRVKEAYKELWLLKSEECEGLVKVSLFSDLQATNDHLQPTNDDMQPTNDPKRKENKREEKKTEEKHAGGTSSPNYFPNDGKLNEAFLDYVDFRRQSGKPMNEKAVTLSIKKLWEMSHDSTELIRILEQSITNGWSGLYPLKDDTKGSPAKNSFNDFPQRSYDYDELERKLRKN